MIARRETMHNKRILSDWFPLRSKPAANAGVRQDTKCKLYVGEKR